MSLGSISQLFWQVKQVDLAKLDLDFDFDSLDIVDLAFVEADLACTVVLFACEASFSRKF